MESNSNTPTTKPADQPKVTEPTAQPKSNKPLLATAIITSILALAGIGASVYFFMDSNNKSTEISDLNAKIASLNSEVNSLQAANSQNNSAGEQTDIEIITETDYTSDKKFADYANTLLTSIKSRDYMEYKRVFKTLNNESFYAIIDHNATLTINGREIANDVIDCDIVTIGNGGDDTYLYFVTKDGKVGRTENLFGFDFNKTPSFSIVDKGQNIISVSSTNIALHPDENGNQVGGGIFPIFIDIDGYIYD